MPSILRPPRTLLWRLCLALIAIQVLGAMVFGTHAYRSAKHFHHQQTVQELQRLVSLLEPAYLQWIVADETSHELTDRLVRELHEQGRKAGVRITLIDTLIEPGRVFADSHRDAASMDNHLHRPEVRAAFETGEGVAVRYSDSVLMDMTYYAERVGDAGGSLIVRTAVPLTAVNADLRRLLWTLGTAGAALLLVTVGLVYIVSRAFSRTVSSLAKQASRLASEVGDGRIERPSASELTALAEALNEMAAQLHDRINQLQAQQHEHEAILQSMNSGVIALDLNQRVLRMNRFAKELLGVGGETAATEPASDKSPCYTGRLLQEVVRSDDLNHYVDAVMRDEARGAVEFRLRIHPESIVQATSSPLTDAGDRRVGVLIVLNDVTPLRRLESLRSDFAANVSHELRTPITSIKGYVETLLEVGVQDAHQARGFLDIIKRNSDRLAAIVEDILSLAWLEQPGTRQALEREVTQIAPVLESVASQFEEAAQAKRITLTVQSPPELAALMNRQLVEQALANYVSNAIKYSPPDTAVTVDAQDSDGWVTISVSDEGPGISREHLPRVFERFYRVDKARSRELGGTGLGLAIVKHIALVHGGRVDVQSTLGQGSVFHLILPRR
jgi:two-component system, OmpR family, phosphate regulon sensor histidine kinase PhoR